MSNLVAIAYPDMATASTVADELHQLDKDGSIAIDDMVVVERRADGKVELHQSHHVSASGAAGGAGVGMMIGFVFFAPLLGMALGAATGAAVGAHTDRGAEDDFMRKLGERLGERGAAVVVLVRKSTPDKVLPRISQYGGDVIESSLGPEREAELRDALAAGQGAAV